MLLLQLARRAASRACWTAGRRIAMRIAMIAITTRSSMSVNPRTERFRMDPTFHEVRVKNKKNKPPGQPMSRCALENRDKEFEGTPRVGRTTEDSYEATSAES